MQTKLNSASVKPAFRFVASTVYHQTKGSPAESFFAHIVTTTNLFLSMKVKMIIFDIFWIIAFFNVCCVVKFCILKRITSFNVWDFSLNALVAPPPLPPMVVIGYPRPLLFDAG